jgi:hypothetical protein
MYMNYLKVIFKTAARGAAVLLLAAGAASAQQQINLTAGPVTATLPDGNAVPMWGYTCGATVSGSTATCAPLKKSLVAGQWSPVVITVPTGQALTINLTNNLRFAAGAGTNTVPTSLMIVGQIGGGLGDPAQRTTAVSPNHSGQGVTWPTANTGPTFTPPAQPNRVQSFGTEVAASSTKSLTWSSLRPGTYLLESGTHPSIQAPMGLIGMLVVTTAPASSTSAGTAYPANGSIAAITYSAEVPMLLSEIDPVQNKQVDTAVRTAGFSETAVWSGKPGSCGDPAVHNCYPPAVNYTPVYYLVNGTAFTKTNAGASQFATSFGTSTAPIAAGSRVLVRLVNAGLRMHVPSMLLTQTTVPTSTGVSPATQTLNGFAILAEDGNPKPGLPHVQNEVFMAAGKTFDVGVNATAAGFAVPFFDRELSLSGNKIDRDAGMLAYISWNSQAVAASPTFGAAVARADTYAGLLAGQPFTVSDPSHGLLANDTNVYGATLLKQATSGVVTLNSDGTFTYTPNTGSLAVADSFTYCANGSVTGTVCSSGITASVTLGAAALEAASGITCTAPSFTSTMATFVREPNPGLLAGCKDAAGYQLSVVPMSITPATGLTVVADTAGGFTGSVSGAGTYTFTYTVKNVQGTVIAAPVTATLVFPTGSGITVKVVDGKTGAAIPGGPNGDYRWIIEEDRSFYINPACTTNPGNAAAPAPCNNGQLPNNVVPMLGTNFHTSDMPFVAQGCTGPLSCEAGQTLLGKPAACDVGNGVCRTTASQKQVVLPGAVQLDPTKHYYISVLPGDAANPFTSGNTSATCSTYTTSQGATASTCGHSMGGASIIPTCVGTTCTLPSTVTVLVEQDPFPPSKLSVDVFEDDFPLNGEQDSGGQVVDTQLATQEPGLGGFNIILWDDMGASGDPTGQMTYDMFNQPLGNSLDGTIDPLTGQNACPISKQAQGITGMIVTCPNFESDGITQSPLGGQAVVSNLMPGRFGVQAIPGADRIARGENWLQTNTLDGQKAHDSFLRIGEPSYFQEFGPAGYHVNIGFANPAIINGRKAGVCAGTDVNVTNTTGCPYTIMGKVTNERLSRTPDERLYSSGSHDEQAFTQCYVSFGDPDGEDFAFAYCNPDGTFQIAALPAGDWRLTTFDEWNDLLVDGLSTPIGLSINAATGKLSCPGPKTSATVCDMGDIATTQWQSNVYTRTFIDDNRDGVSQATETGIPFLNVTVRYRDGSMANTLFSDFNGTANFNETFPLFNWYVVETDVTRYKTTGIHTVYDAGGPADGTLTTCQVSATINATKMNPTAPANGTGYPACGTSAIGAYMANTIDANPLPAALSVPGAIYCPTADCTGLSIQNGRSPSGPGVSTGRIDPGWVAAEGWQGFSGQSNFIEFGKAPYAPTETGGIHGHVVYASTRPFDDPMMLVQTQWEPLVPHVTMNLYQEGLAADGVTKTYTLVDTTQTSSFDDWAQGFRTDGVPNMNCPGQTTTDLFYFSLLNQPLYLDWYNKQHATFGSLAAATPTALPNSSQFKCYDGMHNWNQLQPAPYDGMYSFPSVLGRNPTTGNTTGTNCTICVKNNDPVDAFRFGKEDMLPPGKYVVEVVPPPGYEIVKEEDKNILIGDAFIAPVTQQFGGMGDVFILPDQASVASSQQYPGPGYNGYNAQNPTQNLGTSPVNDLVPGFGVEPVWPCVGDVRTIPDYISLYPQSQQVSPFAGATRPLCDRKEVTLNAGTGATAKFYIFTSTHKASKFTGVITDDFTSEFDPFSPQFGEKFAPPNMPIAVRDWTGAEISRVYSDWWGDYNGMTYSTWEVNPPNPTGYSPTMMVQCMNDKGPVPQTVNGVTTMVTDPLYNPAYSQFCYELPYMPGQTDYLDTPVVPTSAFSAGYNHPDCTYPDATPAIASVTSQDIAGPWVSAAGHTITINALPDQQVNNYGYVGPAGTAAPYNTKTVNRHFGFGGTAGTVTIGGITATVSAWSDTQITAVVPAVNTATAGNTPNGVAQCAVQQQAIYGGKTAYCGQLIITTAAGKQSVDTVTITIGGKTPKLLPASAVNSPGTTTGPGALQQAIDAAQPGDMIIVPPGTYKEMLIMWKPVRLQGVGAASVVIDANAQPAGKLDPWRRQVACLFGIAINGRPITATNPFDDPADTANSGGPFTCSQAMQFSVDREPLEATVGWDAVLNGNLAEMLQEPTLMGAYEGAGITVMGKGVQFPQGSNPFGSDTFPVGTRMLTPSTCLSGGTNPYPSNFLCNPSSIDGLGITNSSQGGGGIYVHGWNHLLQVSNNRVYGNTGTMTGGIEIGQGEFPPQYQAGGTTNADPLSCEDPAYNNAFLSFFPAGLKIFTNQQQPYCFNLGVNVHHNMVTNNSSLGDELFSATLAGAGGVTFCSGADMYKFNYNWICGNFAAGEGGGVSHVGFSYYGDIEHNSILFNQSLNPTIPTNGGGLMVMGAPDTDPVCGTAADADCPPGISNGTGPNLTINANLIQGNAAEAGTGGGLRLQGVNGVEITNFPNNPGAWNGVTITNNVIANNVAGWDGGGVSLEDTLRVYFINNTVMNNDSTATAGILFNTLGAPLASSQTPSTPTANGNTSLPQPAGLVTMQHSSPLTAGLAGVTLTCPTAITNCQIISNPYMANNVFYQNRSFYVGVGNFSTGYQQNLVTMFNSFTGTVPTNQTATGQCVSGSSFWDIGVRGDTGPGQHSSIGGQTLQMMPVYSIMTNASEAGATATTHNVVTNPAVAQQYCNGSRVPPEFGAGTFNVPPGIADATVPNPVFSLQAQATVDEGNNWVNMTWGPLSVSNPTVNSGAGSTGTGNYGSGPLLGNWAPASSNSPMVDFIPPCPAGSPTCTSPTNTAYTLSPKLDFLGHVRPDAGSPNIDAGAFEWGGTAPVPPTITAISPSSAVRGQTVNVTITGTNLAGTTSIGVSGTGVGVNTFTATANTITASFTISSSAAAGARIVTVTSSGLTVTGTFTVNAPVLSSISPATVNRSTSVISVPVTLTGTGFQANSGVAVSGTGVTVVAGSVAFVNSTTITATLSVAAGATAGTRNVTVTSATAGNSNSVGFVVTQGVVAFSAPTPTLAPTTANTGTETATITVTNTATGITAGPVTIIGTGITKGGTAGGTFSITGGTCTAGTVLLNPTNSCTIIVSYASGGNTALATANVTVTDTGAATATQTSANFNAN